MLSLAKIAAILGTVTTVSAAPLLEARQAATSTAAAVATSATATATSAAAAASSSSAGGLTDVDILQFALTLEHLEAAFYREGFQKFPDSDFASLGLSTQQISDLKSTGQTEATHVTVLTQVLTMSGATPVQECNYNFNFTDAATMVATARVLEAVGISAYLGAAPLVQSAAVLTAAGEIVTVEARHQTFIRTIDKSAAVPNAFDSPLGPRAVFTLASQFITSCPTNSNLQIQAFPAIALAGGGANINAGQSLVLANPNQPAGAQFCAFINQGSPTYAPFNGGACTVPASLTGETYMLVTSSKSIADADVLAGPAVIEFS